MRKRFVWTATAFCICLACLALAGCDLGAQGSCPATSSGEAQTTTTGPLLFTIDHTVYAKGTPLHVTVTITGDREVDLITIGPQCSVFRPQEHMGTSWVDTPCGGSGETPGGVGVAIHYFPGQPSADTISTKSLDPGMYRLQAYYQVSASQEHSGSAGIAYSATYHICTR